MQKFLTFVETNDKGELIYYVLQKKYPHYLAYISTETVRVSLGKSTIAGYNMEVVFCGTIEGAFIPSHKQALDEIQEVMDNMASWYLDNRINTDPKKYQKFKL